MKQPGTRIKIGTEWKTRGKHQRTCKVIDILTTKNLAGDIVKIEYRSEHEFMGQMIRHNDRAITILKGRI